MKNVEKVFLVAAKSVDSFLTESGVGLYIPAYQRPYSWEAKKVQRFILDFAQGVTRCEAADDAMTFLGTLIQVTDPRPASVHPKVQSDLPKGVTLIIDGQQRLTTLLIICIVMREAIKEAAKALPNTLDAQSKEWIEKKSARLLQTLMETTFIHVKGGGDEKYELYPRMIRAHDDQWSSDSSFAKYASPIAKLLHQYAVHANDTEADQRAFDFRSTKKELLGHKEFEQALRTSDQMIKYARDGSNEKFTEIAEFADSAEKREVLDRLLGEEAPEPTESTKGVLRLLVLATYLLERVCVTSVSVTEEEYAFDMFEALNTTGEPLTAYETLRPRIIEAETLELWAESDAKKHIDQIDDIFRQKTQPQRQKDTARIVTYFALAESGEKKGRHLADQRRYLRDSFVNAQEKGQELQYVQHLRNLVEFVHTIWSPTGQAIENSWTHPALGGDKEAALALRALSEAGHEIAIAPIVRWYEFWALSDGSSSATKDFSRIVKSLAAFFLVWRLSRQSTQNVDGMIRKLVREGSPDHHLPPLMRAAPGNENLTATLFVTALRSLLESDGIKSGADFGKRLAPIPVYRQSTPHTRLALLLASNDAVASKDKNGLLDQGSVGVCPMLTRERWEETAETIEHVAPQKLPEDSDWDSEIRDTLDAVHRLGNLTILPCSLNASLGNRSWSEKKTIYSLLASTTPEEVKTLSEQAARGGVTIPKTFLEDHKYQAQVQALSKAEEWNLALIENRTLNLAELAWRRLSEWLEFDKG